MGPSEERFTTPEYNISDNNNNATNSNSSIEDYKNSSQKTTSENVSIHNEKSRSLNQSELTNSSLVNDSESEVLNSSFGINSSSNLTQNGTVTTNVSSTKYDQKLSISLQPSNQNTLFVNLTEAKNFNQSNVLNLTTNSSSTLHSNNFSYVSSFEHNPQTIDFTSNSSSSENSRLNATNELNINQTSPMILLITTKSPRDNDSVSTNTTTNTTANSTTATIATTNTTVTTINTTTTVPVNTTTTTPLINFDELGTYNLTIPEKTFIIIAYRNREENKKVFMPEMNNYLSKKVI